MTRETFSHLAAHSKREAWPVSELPSLAECEGGPGTVGDAVGGAPDLDLAFHSET